MNKFSCVLYLFADGPGPDIVDFIAIYLFIYIFLISLFFTSAPIHTHTHARSERPPRPLNLSAKVSNDLSI